MDHVALQVRAQTGEIPLNLEDLWNPRLEVETVPRLMQVAEEHGHATEEALRLVGEFLNSDAAQDAPANDIGALLMAALARKARAGQRLLPSAGMWNDITAIAHFLPYCDAMFVDNECAGLLAEEPLRTQIQSTGRVFCLNTKEEFLAYFRQLEAEAGEEHARRVDDVYGDDWTIPYREILTRERERQDKIK